MPDPRRSAAGELLLLGLGCLLVVGPRRLLQPDLALGRPTRDLYDHLALLDQWALRVDEWSFPEGGVLFPPDLSGMLLAAPFLILGRPLAWTIAQLLQLFLSCLGGWLLGRRQGSGLVGGVAFGLSPYLVGQALSGEGETTAAWPLPLMLLFLEQGGNRGYALGGLMAGLAALTAWYHGVFAGVLLAGWLLFRSGLGRGAERGAEARPLLAPLLAGLVVLGPALLYIRTLRAPDQLFRGPTMGTYLADHPRALATMSADPAAFLGAAVPGVEHVDHLGFLVVLLAGLGLVRLWKERPADALWWGGIVLLGLVLALGPIIHWAGAELLPWGPYRLLAAIPPLDLMRLPHRWLLVATLGLSVLAARGARGLPGWLVGGFILVETAWFLVPERPATEITVPAVVSRIDAPVLDLPARTIDADTRGRFLVWQREHRQPTAYSLLMTGWSPSLSQEPLVQAVAAMDRLARAPERQAEAAQFRQRAFAAEVARIRQTGVDRGAVKGAGQRLSALGFGLVVLHLDLLHDGDRAPILALVEGALGPGELVGDALLWRLEGQR